MLDFIFSEPDTFEGKTVLELGCGVGLVGIALNEWASRIFLTDHDCIALALCKENVTTNAEQTSHIKIRSLDWFDFDFQLLARERSLQERSQDEMEKDFLWTSLDLEELSNVEVFFAADVIYDHERTLAFFHVLEKLMRRSKNPSICYLSLEKRYNFTLMDLDVKATEYDHFLSFLERDSEPAPDSEKCFLGEQISLSNLISVQNRNQISVYGSS